MEQRTLPRPLRSPHSITDREPSLARSACDLPEGAGVNLNPRVISGLLRTGTVRGPWQSGSRPCPPARTTWGMISCVFCLQDDDPVSTIKSADYERGVKGPKKKTIWCKGSAKGLRDWTPD